MLTLQIFVDGTWRDAATLTFQSVNKGDLRTCRVEYLNDYIVKYYGRQDNAAASLLYPVDISAGDRRTWPRFFDDIIPSGAGRRFWVQHHQLTEHSAAEVELILLEHGVISPVGNLRIKEAVEPLRDGAVDMLFAEAEVADRNADFLEYAIDRGAIAGGATGAGGEAPKLIVRQRPDGAVWIDTFQEQLVPEDSHYLVKFPRNRRQAIDCDILRAEKLYYQELDALGINTVSMDGLKLIEGEHYPSLWLPRFDVERSVAGIKRYGLESLYSVLDVAPGAYLKHEDVLAKLVALNERIGGLGCSDFADFVVEWVKRDLLNIVFGNSDNHGRNTSFLKGEGWIQLAPVYDFAPMKADPEGVVRTIRWQKGEQGGQYDYELIARQLSDYIQPERLLTELRDFSQSLIGLYDRLAERGVPDSILKYPAMSLAETERKLKHWGLL